MSALALYQHMSMHAFLKISVCVYQDILEKQHHMASFGDTKIDVYHKGKNIIGQASKG